MFHNFIKASMVVLLGLATPSVAAQDTVELRGDVKVVKVEDQDGAQVEHLEAPDKVVPGDRLMFKTWFRNASGEVVRNFVVTNPLPEAVALADQGDFDVSVDGGATFGRLAALSVGAGAEKRAAQLSDVTHIRWILEELKPQSSGELTYYATVR